MAKCKECKYFDNTVPCDTIRNERDKHKTPDKYIGMCRNIGCIKMMNDTCILFEKKEVTDNDT